MLSNTYLRLIFVAALSICSLAQAAPSVNCALGRQLIERNGQTFYVVGDRARTLYMISRDLYGDEKNWKQLATWNKLSEPYVVNHGQQLWIKSNDTIIEESKSNEIVIQAWEYLNNKSMPNRLKAYSNDASCKPKKEEAPVVAAVTEFVDKKNESEKTPEPAIEATTQTAPSLAEIFATPQTPAESAKETTSEKSDGGHESAFKYSAALTTSFFKISSHEEAEETKNTLNSSLNYGVDLGLHYEASEKWTLSAVAGVEQINLKPAEDGSEVERNQQTLLKLNLEVEYEVYPNLKVYGGAVYVQRPFYRKTDTGVTIDPIYLPEVVIGDHFLLTETNEGKAWLVTEASYSFQVKDSHHNVKAGYGYIVGLKFDREFAHSTLSFLPAYRYLKEDTETSKENQDAFIMSLGYEW